MSIEFLLTSLVIIASPGTGVLYTLAAGLSRGKRASVVAAGPREASTSAASKWAPAAAASASSGVATATT